MAKALKRFFTAIYPKLSILVSVSGSDMAEYLADNGTVGDKARTSKILHNHRYIVDHLFTSALDDISIAIFLCPLGRSSISPDIEASAVAEVGKLLPSLEPLPRPSPTDW